MELGSIWFCAPTVICILRNWPNSLQRSLATRTDVVEKFRRAAGLFRYDQLWYESDSGTNWPFVVGLFNSSCAGFTVCKLWIHSKWVFTYKLPIDFNCLQMASLLKSKLKDSRSYCDKPIMFFAKINVNSSWFKSNKFIRLLSSL